MNSKRRNSKADNMDSSSNDDAPPNKEEGIQVICAGLGRTGTLSLTEALQTLGYKSYHYVDFSHIPQWAEVARGERSNDEIIDIIANDGYTATLENPTSDIYQDILKRYPNAKVVLTVRDNPQAFVKSWKILMDTMVVTESTFSWSFPSFFGYIPMFGNLKAIRYMMGTTHLGLSPGELTHGWRTRSDDDWLVEQYERHNGHVMDHVPKDQLLVFNVKEGWEPLCAFLGHEIPDTAFPHSNVNTAASLLQLRGKFLMIVYGWIPTLVTLGTAVYFGTRRMRGARQQQQQQQATKLHQN
jgi:hypothetical protein